MSYRLWMRGSFLLHRGLSEMKNGIQVQEASLMNFSHTLRNVALSFWTPSIKRRPHSLDDAWCFSYMTKNLIVWTLSLKQLPHSLHTTWWFLYTALILLFALCQLNKTSFDEEWCFCLEWQIKYWALLKINRIQRRLKQIKNTSVIFFFPDLTH